MALVIGDRVCDSGLSALDTECDKIYVCSAQPTTYTEATSTYALGNKNFGAGAAFAAPTGASPGRKTQSVAITDGSVTANGTVSHWAAVDSANSRLLASDVVAGGTAVTSGQQFTLGSFAVQMAGTSGGAAAMSLVLAAASSQYLSRTWGSNPTEGKKGTLAFWVKRTATISANMWLYDGGNGTGTSGSGARFNASDSVCQLTLNDSVSFVSDMVSGTAVTDTAWHHICIAFDSTDGAELERVDVYLDGVEVTYGGTPVGLIQNDDYRLSESGVESNIGRWGAAAGQFFDGKLAYFYFIDGQTLTPSSFTTGTGAGSIHPATYAGTYNTNGFFLNFTGSATTDQGTQGNHWTANAGPTFSSDVPT